MYEFNKFYFSFGGFKLIGEGVASFGIHRLVKLLWNQTQVYYYKSTFIGRYSRLNAYDKKLYGVEHEDDLQYILHIPDIGPVYKLSDVENEKIEQMSRLWINFAKYGFDGEIFFYL